MWILTNAIASLRRRLSDGPTDKYVHQMDTDPHPNGVVTRFAVPDTRLIPDTLVVTKNAQGVTPTSVNLTDGSFVLDPPPLEPDAIRASYYFQWFTDEELTDFLMDALQLLGYASVDDASIPVPVRTPILSFASSYAYRKKAAYTADALSASSAGFTSDTTKQHPNWMGLAKAAWEQAQAEMETIGSLSPQGVSVPAMRFVSFRMHRYVPRS